MVPRRNLRSGDEHACSNQLDSNHEGDNSEMPAAVWDTVCGTLFNCDITMAGMKAHVVVRLTNLAWRI